MPSAPTITFLQKGSNVPNKVPLATDLLHKELAVNYYDGILFTLKTDNSIIKFLSHSYYPYVLSPSLSTAVPQYGNNVVGNNSANGAILGGNNNYLNHSNSFIMGTGISSVSSDYTFVNNLSSTAKIEPTELILKSDDGTKWRIVVSNSGVITAVDTSQLTPLYWYAQSNNNWFDISNWFADSGHTTAVYRLPTSNDGVYILGPTKPTGELDANWNDWVNPGFINVGTVGLELSGTNKTITTKFRGTAPVSFYGSITVTNP